MNWDQLLQQSETLVARDAQGFPRIERDILQVEQLSRQLKAKSTKVDGSQDALAASRLLAQEGLNAQRLTAATNALELRPTYEDVLEPRSADLDEYLEQVHEMTVTTAISRAQEELQRTFQRYMDESLQQQWAAAKRQLLEGAMPYGALTMSPGPSAPSAATGLTVLRPPLGPPDAVAHAPLTGRAERYATVVQSLSQSPADTEPVARFEQACLEDGGVGDKRATMHGVWQLLRSVVAEGNGVDAMVQGARRYLHGGFVTYINNVIKANRSTAALGGDPGKLALVHAFLRVREKERLPLDFDARGGTDTAWERLYFCMRSGFGEEAMQVATQCRDLLPVATRMSDMLRGWFGVSGAPAWTAGHASWMTQECERLLRDRSALGRTPSMRYKLLVCAVLSGDATVADSCSKEITSLLTTIEDFLWYRLTLIRSARLAQAGGGGGGVLTGAYTLEDLQQYLQQFPASHFAQNGKEPLLYVMVVLLTMQFHTAIMYLAQDASTRSYRIDAPHVAIALHLQGTLSPSDDGASERSALVHLYGKQFVAVRPELALEYYMLAAAIEGNGLESKGRLLRELLVESKAYGYLLGSGGPAGDGGALARFVSSQADRQALVDAVARACQQAAQLQEAVELYMHADRPEPALHLINQMLADGVEAAVAGGPGSVAADTYDALVRRGNAAAEALASRGGDGARREVATLTEVRAVYGMAAAESRGNYTEALQRAQELSFLPHERFRLQMCVQAAGLLHPALAKLLPYTLLVAARALNAVHQSQQLQLLAAFAGALPQRINQGVLQQIVRLEATASSL